MMASNVTLLNFDGDTHVIISTGFSMFSFNVIGLACSQILPFTNVRIGVSVEVISGIRPMPSID